ncbi:MAG: CvpA family protein, partial [Betaproteobacteria bacterium]|nr:CvpA family protein [Betaproteobacteria bacterium]
AWLVIFLMVLIVISTLASLLSEITKKIGLGGLNRAVGALIGILRGLVVLIALTLVAGLTRIPESSLWREAKLTPALEVMAKYTRSILPDSIASQIHYRPTEKV